MKIRGNLNNQGIGRLLEFVQKYHRLPLDELNLQAFVDQVNLSEKKHYEESQFSTKSGRPETIEFDDSDFHMEDLEN
jgi:hypothetical protein